MTDLLSKIFKLKLKPKLTADASHLPVEKLASQQMLAWRLIQGMPSNVFIVFVG